MIGALQRWLCSVFSVSLLLSVAEMLMPEGNVRRIGGFIGGLLLMFTLLQPVLQIQTELPEINWERYEQAIEKRQKELTESTAETLQKLIESRTAAYISDKADSLGVSVAVRVGAKENGEGVTVPEWVEITGAYCAELADWLERDLGVPPERQVWNEGKN